MDLAPFAGKTCRQWIYQVNNYPEEGTVRATVLVYEGQIIGGDISSTELDGFLCGFAGQSGDGQDTSEGTASSQTGSTQEAGKDEGKEEAESKTEEEPESSAESAGADIIPEDAWPTD